MNLDFDGAASLNRLHGNQSTPMPVNTPKKSPGQVIELPKPPTRSDGNSEDQDLAKARCAQFLLDGKSFCFSVVGPAGSGKTFLINQIIHDAKAKGWNIVMSAPTHQAAARIREATGCTAETTHRILSVSLVRDESTGKQYLKAKGKPDILPRSILIIDEASMLPEQLLKIVLKFSKRSDCKVIFVGDAAQLNPVKEKPCIAVDKETCEWELVELTTIHRQAAGNPIIQLATAIRTADPRKLPPFETNIVHGAGVKHFQNHREWANLLIEQCSMDKQQHRYIAYTNRATDEAAKAVRRHKYGNAAEQPYLAGEVLVVNSRCIPPDAQKKSRSRKKREDQVVIQANDMVTVKSVWQDRGFYFVECDWHGHTVVIKALESYHEREKHLESLRRVAIMNSNWRDFFDASDSIADLRSAVSITAHSSQGSTFDNCFINLTNVRKCTNYEERQRLLYVAVTRSSNMVYSVGAL